ncbi:uncharacterized protein EAF02_004526 [Botrytis sinoallii]|uniref:uncharacterized protein n=1 Tax=Botrytis sinoallii TaxID=1463999 RepID=UPI0019018524|nr:uncharacterized protein EAF02_004526 [Botrytis sinoallii]KAF7884190.1 hypothetical protein EAF02_004526 [Botrytis sinoallii]
MSQTQTIHQSLSTEVPLSVLRPEAVSSSQNTPSRPLSDPSSSPLESTSNFALILKITSSILAFFTAGLNDGSLGSLIPYILDTYSLSTSSIAFLYLSCFLGWVIAAITIPFLQTHLRLGIGGILLLGASLQLLTQFIRIWGSPWPLFVVSFGLAALGQAYQDAQANTYIAQVGDKAHRWLGVVHAAYSVGCLLGPLAVTGIATVKPVHWMESYGALAGVAGLNVCVVAWAFARDIVTKTRHDQDSEEQGEESEQSDHARRGNAMWRDIGEVLREKSVWIISFFFFFHLGSVITIGGWLVTYLLTLAPNSGIQASSIGYLPTLFYAGNALGRLFLIEPTHRFGEKPMILLYSLLCIILQIISWRLSSLIGSVVIVCLLGFLLGPFFPAAITHTKLLLPSRIITPASSIIFVIAQAGGNIFPAMTGILAANLDGGDGAGARVLQPVVLGLLGCMMGAWWFVPGVDLAIDGNQPESGIRILAGKGWSNADAVLPDDWKVALPFTKTSYSKILSASSFNIPSNFLQIHRSGITRSFKTTSTSSQTELLTTLTFKLGSAINNWNLLTLSKSSSTRITTGLFIAHEDIDIVPLPFNVDSYLGVSQPWCIARLFIRHKLKQLDDRINNTEVDINAIESVTGQHNRWVDTDKIQNSNNQGDENYVSSIDPLHIDFIGTTTDLSKAEYSVAGLSVCIKGALFATKVLDGLDQEGKQTIGELRDHCEHMLLKMEYLQMRRDALLSVIQQFQAEASARRAIFLTEASTDLAKASRKDSEVMKIIAIDTKRDSKAMKTIAIL